MISTRHCSHPSLSSLDRFHNINAQILNRFGRKNESLNTGTLPYRSFEQSKSRSFAVPIARPSLLEFMLLPAEAIKLSKLYCLEKTACA